MLSSMSNPPIPGQFQFPESDKILHALAFGITGAAAALGALVRKRFWGWAIYLEALCLTSFYGMIDEIHQIFTPMRTPDVLDWVADTLGAAIGVLLFFVASKYIARKYEEKFRPYWNCDGQFIRKSELL